MSTFQARQGDILFMALAVPPQLDGALPRNDTILAQGEATGHAHRLVCVEPGNLEMRTLPSGDILVLGGGPMRVIHEEHEPVSLPAGQWILVRRQREYDPLAMERQRKALD